MNNSSIITAIIIVAAIAILVLTSGCAGFKGPYRAAVAAKGSQDVAEASYNAGKIKLADLKAITESNALISVSIGAWIDATVAKNAADASKYESQTGAGLSSTNTVISAKTITSRVRSIDPQLAEKMAKAFNRMNRERAKRGESQRGVMEVIAIINLIAQLEPPIAAAVTDLIDKSTVSEAEARQALANLNAAIEVSRKHYAE